MVKTTFSAPVKLSQSRRRALQMERYYEQRRQHQEWRRQKKRDDQDSIVASQLPNNAAILNPNRSHDGPISDQLFHQFPFLATTADPTYLGSSKCSLLPRPIEPPKTPPSFSTASFRRRHPGPEPISPPNPLRLASTTASQLLPRPDASHRYIRSTQPPLCAEPVGDPCLSIFRVKLPDYLIHGAPDVLVAAAEAYVNRLPNGWRTNLYSLTKCDIACEDIPGISSYIHPIMVFISLSMKMLYGCRKITLDHNQPHILKYSAEIGHTGVGLHCDRCDITANLSLSKRDSYKGGGTFIAAINQTVRLEQGEILLHPGNLVHSGVPITAGTRFLLVAFANFER